METRGELYVSEVQYQVFCDTLRAECGLAFDDRDRYVVERRLKRRLNAIGVDSFATYLHRLRSPRPGDDELAQLIDHLTTNETYFFREMNQLRALGEEILPELLRNRKVDGSGEPVRVWSAGCSSGEEPCSIVMMALEAGLDVERELNVCASDISRGVLSRARKGIYRESAFRETPDAMRERYFTEKEGLYRISDSVKGAIDYAHLNLLDSHRWSLLRPMDVILCRNVLIYFDEETRKQVIQGFYEKLRPGGYLLLGHSESLVNLSSAFELCHLRNDMVYRRPPEGEGRTDSWHRLAEEALDGEVAGR